MPSAPDIKAISRSVRRAACCLTVLGPLATAADAQQAPPPRGHMTAPGRVVSMNLCTDQLTLMIARPDQIHSLSYVSRDPASSPLAREAARYRPNHGLAEEIFLMKPDLVLAGRYTRPETTRLLSRLGFHVETFAPAQSFTDIRANIRRLGELLGRQTHAQDLLAKFDRALARREVEGVSPPRRQRPLAALYYANSYTSGRGSLAADILAHARLDNLASTLGLAGIVRLPLELVVFNRPDLLIMGDAGGTSPTAEAATALTHPALRNSRGKVVTIDNRWACGTPAVLDIVRELEHVVLKRTPRKIGPKPAVKG